MSAKRLVTHTVFLLLCSVVAACVPRARRQPVSQVVAPVAASPAAPAAPPKKIRMAVLPAEPFLLPKVAPALNERLGKVQVPGVDEAVVASISMETAQLQAECTDTGEACWKRVAQMVSADRLLWCEMERATKKKRGPVKVRVTLFDAETAAVLARAEETFTSTASDEALDKLVGQVVGPARPAVSPASTGAAPAGSAAAPATSPASAAK